VAPYALFKGAMEVLTRYMAKEFGDMRIHVNAVSPSAIRTELGGGVSGEFEAALASQTALGRVEEVARAIDCYSPPMAIGSTRKLSRCRAATSSKANRRCRRIASIRIGLTQYRYDYAVPRCASAAR
jgi:NAD(P)-dependent dehydrogenase (short-subunit alcohol dehydrogenase family)